MNDRKLVTIERIIDIIPIPDADAIERVRVRGWDVVTRKGDFAVGDVVAYAEVDTFLPIVDPRFAFLAPRGVRVQDDVEGHVLKTARLRGQYSQGIVFDLKEFPELAGVAVGEDVTDLIPGVTKWDPPLPAELAGEALGFFPDSVFRKTDEERIQNLSGVLTTPGPWQATEKVDGTSMSVMLIDGVERIAGRNIEFAERPGHTMWELARGLDLFARMKDSFPGLDVTVQGELIGPGIQGNPLKLKQVTFLCFTAQTREPGGVRVELPRAAWPAWLNALSVPVHDLAFPKTLEEALAQADRRPSLVPGAQGHIEGIVWKHTEGASVPGLDRPSFKVLSQKYLMVHDR